MAEMNILVTLDENYVPPLFVMLKSLIVNCPGPRFTIYLAHSGISDNSLNKLGRFMSGHGLGFCPVKISEDMFKDAPVFRHYTKAMYYRLLAHEFLPETMERILYLDPDILVINPIDPLYNLDMEGSLYAAAIHSSIVGISERINKFRLSTYEAEGYYNSGVMLMNLTLHKTVIDRNVIFDYVKNHEKEFILPDQDILNGLYGNQIQAIDDSIYNYDARHFDRYQLLSGGVKDLDWVMANTALLHFCGKSKPWHKSYRNKFGSLYKHYARLAARDVDKLE